MFVPSARHHAINTSCQNLPKKIYKTVIPDTEFSHAFLFGNKTMQRWRCSRRKFTTTASGPPAVGSQSRMSRTVSETPKEAWRTVLRGNRRNQENHRNIAFPVIVCIKHAKQVKNRRKKNNTATIRRYIACVCSTVHAAEGKPPVLITASAEWHRSSGRCPQKATVIIKTHCKAQGKRSRVRTAKEEGHKSNKIAKARAKTSDDRYTRSG